MSDAASVYRAAPERKRGMLKTLWPELYEALGGDLSTANPDAPAKVIPCAVHPCSSYPSGKRRPAVGRVTRWGPEACQRHIETLSDRPGGWPLDLMEHRILKEDRR